MPAERSPGQSGKMPFENGRSLGAVTPDTPQPRTRWMLRLGDGKGIERTTNVPDIHAARLLHTISDAPSPNNLLEISPGEVSSEIIVAQFPFHSFGEMGILVDSTKQVLAEDGIELRRRVINKVDGISYGIYSLRDEMTGKKLKILQTTHITDSKVEVKQAPNLNIDDNSGDVSVQHEDQSTTTVHFRNPVTRDLFIHIMSQPGEILTNNALSNFISEAKDKHRISNFRKPVVGVYISQLRRMLERQGATLVTEPIPLKRGKFDYRFNGIVQEEPLPDEAPTSSYTEDGREIVPGRPVLQVLRGEGYALVLHNDGQTTKRVTVRGDYSLEVFDYLVNHQNQALNTRSISDVVNPETEENRAYTYVGKLRSLLSKQLEIPDLLQTVMARQASTVTMAANVNFVKPIDIASGESPYEVLNNPGEQSSLVWVRGTDRILQLRKREMELLSNIQTGEENAQTPKELGEKLWPDKPVSEIHTPSVRSNLRHLTRNIGTNAPQIRKIKIDGQDKYFIDGVQAEAFRQRHLAMVDSSNGTV